MSVPSDGDRTPVRGMPAIPGMRRRWLTALDRLRHRVLSGRGGDGAMVGLAAAVGVGTGLAAVVLIGLVRGVRDLTFGGSPDPWQAVLVPALGGLVVGLLIAIAPSATSGTGVTEVMRAIALHGGRMHPLTIAVKTLATGVALGTGAAGGREGPIVQIGGGVGSGFGGLLGLDEERRRALIAAGAAGGIAASFNAPIGGMLFAMEVMIGGFKVRSLQVVVVAAVLASVVSRQLIGEDLIYDIRGTYELADPRELLLHALLGVAAVGVAWAFMRALDWVRRVVQHSSLPAWSHPAAGGLVLGVLALAVPDVLGTGDELPRLDGLVLGTEPIRSMIEGEPATGGWIAVGLLGVLLIAKIAASAVTIGSGSPVGTFAPSLFMGAALGGAIGHTTAILLPEAGIQPGAYALVGMAAVFGATAKAPLTGILIVFELTSDYGLVLPLMLATGLATFLADRLWEGTIYTRQLQAEGIVYAEPDDVDVLQTVTVGEVMTADPVSVRADDPVSALQQVFTAGGSHGHPVLDDDGRLVGVVTVSDVERRMDGRDPDGTTIGEIATRRVSTVTPADPVFRAVRRMAALGVGRMPVVDPQDHGRLVGMVRRADLVKAYQRAITRSLGVQQRNDRARLRDLAGTTFAEVVLRPGSAADGRQVKDIDWPARTVLTSIRRDGEVITPAGDTVLHAGDEVVFLTGSDGVDAVRAVLADPVDAA